MAKKNTAAETRTRNKADERAALGGEAPPTRVAKKKAKKKPDPPKAKPPTEGLLFDPHKIAPRGKKLASIYKETSEAKSKSTGAHKSAQDNLIDWMEESGTHRIPVELGGVRKVLVLDNVDKIRIETAAEPPKAEAVGS